MSSRTEPPLAVLPKRLVTQTLPWLSMPSPLPLNPALKVSALVGSEAGKRVTESAEGAGYPDAVLLVNAEVERAHKRPARRILEALAQQLGLARIPLGDVNQLVLGNAHHPDIAARRNDHTLHQAELVVEGDAVWTCQDLPFLSNFEMDVAAIAGEPDIVLVVNRITECAAGESAAVEASGYRRERLTVRRELS